MIARKLILGAAAAALAAAGFAGVPAEARTLKFIVSWAENNTMAFLPAAQLAANLKDMGSDLELEVSGPETVPPFEQIAPTTAGVFDMIYTYPAYHSKGITVVTNAMEPDMDRIRSSGVFDGMDTYLQTNHNLKLLANVAIGSAGYHCYMTKPLDASGRWDGRKIRSVPTYDNLIKTLGGAPVTAPMGEVYSSMEKGVFDGACAPQSVFRATKHFEVARYRTEPTFGQLVSYIAINLDSWNGLTDKERDDLTKASIQTEKDTIRIGNDTIGADLAAMKDAGVEVTKFPDAVAAEVVKAYYDGIWGIAEECCGADTIKSLRDKAKAAGLTN
jgi:TRAP-type C4-dicarboxylate transport system substrate-binding protein